MTQHPFICSGYFIWLELCKTMCYCHRTLLQVHHYVLMNKNYVFIISVCVIVNHVSNNICTHISTSWPYSAFNSLLILKNCEVCVYVYIKHYPILLYVVIYLYMLLYISQKRRVYRKRARVCVSRAYVFINLDMTVCSVFAFYVLVWSTLCLCG